MDPMWSIVFCSIICCCCSNANNIWMWLHSMGDKSLYISYSLDILSGKILFNIWFKTNEFVFKVIHNKYIVRKYTNQNRKTSKKKKIELYTIVSKNKNSIRFDFLIEWKTVLRSVFVFDHNISRADSMIRDNLYQ